ncbi:MAG: nuclear transport factor 2 family protein [Gammaproteobacteria bacterium]|nr:nuclear transport factor 2 family protein [Gammaproteobacteria bacterium]
MKLILIILLATLGLGLYWLLSRPPVPKPYLESYRTALLSRPGSKHGIDSGLEQFRKTFADLASPETEQHVLDLYAAQMYFNDTLKQFDRRETLAAYMGHMAASIESSEVHVEQELRDGSDVFLRWTMRFTSRALGRNIVSETIGMTHLRFNDQGEVVLHQDFWDPASGLYRHLPLIGWLLDLVDRRLGPG